MLENLNNNQEVQVQNNGTNNENGEVQVQNNGTNNENGEENRRRPKRNLFERIIAWIVAAIEGIFNYIWKLVKRWLLFNAGVSEVALEKTQSRYELTKYLILGTIVLIPTIMAFLEIYYVLSTYVTTIPPVTVAIIITVIIYLLERIIVGAPTKNGAMKWFGLLSRFILALSFAYLVGGIMELAFFEKDLNPYLDKYAVIEADQTKNEYDGRIALLVAEKNREINLRDSLQNEYIQEMQGRGSGRVGEGEIAKAIKLQKEQKDVVIQELEEKIEKLEKEKEEKITEIKENFVKNSGLGLRQTAMHDLMMANSYIFIFVLFLKIFFVGLDLIPIIFKLILKDGPYEVGRAYEISLREKEATEKLAARDAVFGEEKKRAIALAKQETSFEIDAHKAAWLYKLSEEEAKSGIDRAQKIQEFLGERTKELDALIDQYTAAEAKLRQLENDAPDADQKERFKAARLQMTIELTELIKARYKFALPERN